MPRPLLSDQIASLETLRGGVAQYNKDLANRELDGRLLRLRLETELRQSTALGGRGLVKTEAEKEAKSHDDYIAFERETIRLTFDREILLARAEKCRLEIDLQMETLRRVPQISAGEDNLRYMAGNPR